MRIVLVPTPIGNLKDITLRALETFREVEAVACEDTRRTGFLLHHYGIQKPLVRLDQHTLHRAKEVLAPYAHVAYATDAGTPGISDPGAELVRMALEWGWHVEALPGPTAFLPALILSGFPTHRFTFEGFLPKGGKERRERMERLRNEGRTAVLYESLHRLRRTLKELADLYGPGHKVAVVRELTKLHEEVFRGSLEEALDHFQTPRGEFVLVLPPLERAQDPVALAQTLRAQGLKGRGLREALIRAGVGRNEAYRLSLEEE
ncbi:MAG: 16S rRNA (cytidine(1402)-2'-O)-methyltransferase [Thermus sp.]